MLAVVDALKSRRWAHLAVVNLRILLGFAFLPAGLKKIIGQPFTDLDNVGPFHDFLHALLATGPFYHFLGAVQLACALLLMTQRYAQLGALMALPLFTTIGVFCWSTAGIFTCVMVTLMWLGTIGLLVWDIDRWRAMFSAQGEQLPTPPVQKPVQVDLRLWSRCGALIYVGYLILTALRGGVYRPRGVEWDNPSFYTLPLIATVPIITWLIERRRRLSTTAR